MHIWFQHGKIEGIFPSKTFVKNRLDFLEGSANFDGTIREYIKLKINSK